MSKQLQSFVAKRFIAGAYGSPLKARVFRIGGNHPTDGFGHEEARDQNTVGQGYLAGIAISHETEGMIARRMDALRYAKNRSC